MIDLDSQAFADKVLGCWMGKNCGGTLGAPLEKAFGEDEPFDIWWYPKIQEGGIPNDDLEMQLIWLKALEEIGPQLKAVDLAEYWLNCIGYNFDEYGMSKHNLTLGLRPPVSGWYNNWFRDCMGCPIRSEIWACVAPGAPRVAVRYGYEDGICDHAGGEGVIGEFFNVAIQSSAFVETDRAKLIEIGLSYVPEDSRTFAAVRAALDAHTKGVDWREARRRVLAAVYNRNSQYAPLNMAFQTIGWLWGDDFGDALCKAVNCGWDTDCTGATLGSILGIIEGRKALPEKWTAPLGDEIATNASWGGLKNVTGIPNPIPADLNELTRRTIAQTHRVLAYHQVSPSRENLFADADTRALLTRKPSCVTYFSGSLRVALDYGSTPSIQPGQKKSVSVEIFNSNPEKVTVQVSSTRDDGSAKILEIDPRQSSTVEMKVRDFTRRELENINPFYVSVRARDRVIEPMLPMPLVGARALRRSEVFTAATDRAAFDTVFAPEKAMGDALLATGREGRWAEYYAAGNCVELDAADFAGKPGAIYVQSFLEVPTSRKAFLGLASNCPLKAWLNGKVFVETYTHATLRPNYAGSGEDSGRYGDVEFREGWNELLIKYISTPGKPPVDGHIVYYQSNLVGSSYPDIGRTRFPWDIQA